jgi:ribonuclease HI
MMLDCKIYTYGYGSNNTGQKMGIGIYVELDGSPRHGYHGLAEAGTANKAIRVAISEAFKLAESQAAEQRKTTIYTTEKSYVQTLNSRFEDSGISNKNLSEPKLVEECCDIWKKHQKYIVICAVDRTSIGIKVAKELARIASEENISELVNVNNKALISTFNNINKKLNR